MSRESGKGDRMVIDTTHIGKKEISPSDSELWKALGLARNEVKIYETLLQEGESSVGKIVMKSKIHRRNVYDSLKRLTEKGLVFEIMQKRESLYQAVDPRKLAEMLEEKRKALSQMMPRLLSSYESKPRKEEVIIYRGIEAYRNEMRDIIKVGQDVYVIGGKALWTSDQLEGYVENFVVEANSKHINFHFIWDHEVGTRHKILTDRLHARCKNFGPEFTSFSTVDVFGDHTVMFSKGKLMSLEEDITLTVIINERIANAFKIWFKCLWESI